MLIFEECKTWNKRSIKTGKPDFALARRAGLRFTLCFKRSLAEEAGLKPMGPSGWHGFTAPGTTWGLQGLTQTFSLLIRYEALAAHLI
jgi:hypothetical protein